MYKPLENRWRRDLEIKKIPQSGKKPEYYQVKIPNSDQIFEFGLEEYFLCQSLNGVATTSEIVDNFKSRFNVLIAEEDFLQFANQLVEYNLLESIETVEDIQDYLQQPSPLPDIRCQESARLANSNFTKKEKKKKKEQIYLWYADHPSRFFATLKTLFQPFSILFKIIIWGLIPGIPIALLTLFHNQFDFWSDYIYVSKSWSYLATYIFNLILASLSAKVAQGIVFTCYGGTVTKFGMVLAGGFLPRFYIDREAMWQLQRPKQLWTLATPVIVRPVLFVWSILIWYFHRETGTQLSNYALLLAHASFIDFLLDASPLWPSDGYVWTTAYFRLPSDLFQRSFLIWQMLLNGRPLPKSLSIKQKLGLQLFLLGAGIFTVLMIFIIISLTASGLAANFSGLFGNGTGYIILFTLLVLALRQPVTRFLQNKSNSYNSQKSLTKNMVTSAKESAYPNTKNGKAWLSTILKTLTMVGGGLVLLLPYPYRSGGQIKLTTSKQQQIQAEVDGKITRVLFKGGDGTWLKAGTVVAVMESPETNNEFSKTQEQINSRQADLRKQQAELAQLLSTPKKEDVELAQQQVEVAKQQVETAKQKVKVAEQQIEVSIKSLQTAISKSEFSAREAERFKYLLEQGAYSQQQYEDADKRATTELNTVEEIKQNIEKAKQSLQEAKEEVLVKLQNVKEAEANLKVVKSGPYPQEIEAAREEVVATNAEIQRLRQELKYLNSKIKRSTLKMPFDGYIATSELQQKVGMYLEQGDTFATVENSRNIYGELQIPEYEVSEIVSNGKVEVKLSAYPNEPFIGRVVSIQPVATTDDSLSKTSTSAESGKTVESSNPKSGQFVKVVVEIPKTEKILKSGMSGYAKIEGKTMPVILAFTRPIVRFIQIEMWSWIP
jgi:multidrug resistance efflux pump